MFKKPKIILFISFILLLYFLKKYKYSNIKVCLCVIGKKENLYAKEFINHYKKLGYNHIFIYDNNDFNDEKFEDVIQNEINHNFVSIINYRGYKGKEKHPQFDAYKDCYEKNHKNYDWLSFFDFDEFLDLKHKDITIQDFLNHKRFKNCENIKINWSFYKDNNSLFYINKPIQQRIKTLGNPNKHIKSTIRGNLLVNYWSKMNNPHSSLIKVYTCNSKGKKIKHDTPFNDPPDIKYAVLKHYQYKSLEEYCFKILRGSEGTPNNIYKQRMLKLLFQINY